VRLHTESTAPDKSSADLLAFPVPEGAGVGGAVARIDRALGRRLSERVRDCDFKGKRGEVLLHPVPPETLPSRCVLLVGMGRDARAGGEAWRRYGAVVRAEARRQGAGTVACVVGPGRGTAAAVAEGFLLAGYRFDRYKSDTGKRREPEDIALLTARGRPGAARDLERAEIVAREVCRVRDIVNEPARVKTPTYLAEVATAVGRECGLRVEVWRGRRLETQKLVGLLAVAQGSREPPRFIVLRYRPAGRPRKRVALVGKGLTFDSGGLSLKPAKSMETMKLDVAGGATVIGTMAAIGRLRPRVEVTGYVPATENLPGGGAQKPGDVLKYMNGKTVEVLNTDAEGRLILADALAIASRNKPDMIIDLATLTGACMVALGTQVAGIMGNDPGLIRALMAAGRTAGEQLWELPLVADYRDEIKSAVADVKNVGGQYAGTITAGLFLQEFVDEVPWAHLDIAGPAFVEKDLAYAPRGGTGFGLRTLVTFLTGL
jgi:leucyl aminopeptidase